MEELYQFRPVERCGKAKTDAQLRFQMARLRAWEKTGGLLRFGRGIHHWKAMTDELLRFRRGVLRLVLIRGG